MYYGLLLSLFLMDFNKHLQCVNIVRFIGHEESSEMNRSFSKVVLDTGSYSSKTLWVQLCCVSHSAMPSLPPSPEAQILISACQLLCPCVTFSFPHFPLPFPPLHVLLLFFHWAAGQSRSSLSSVALLGLCGGQADRQREPSQTDNKQHPLR